MLRCKPGPLPILVISLCKQDAVVHTAAAALPEFYMVRYYSVASPVSRAGYLYARKFSFVLGIVNVQYVSVGDLFALW